MGENLYDSEWGKEFLNITAKPWSIKEKYDKLLFQNLKLLLSERHSYENEKSSHRLGWNICKSHIWQRIPIPSMQRCL